MSFSAFLHSGVLKLKGGSSASDGSPTEAYQVNTSKLSVRLWDVFSRTFDLGVTAFGGPPVHFQIFYRRFVDGAGKVPWIDDQTYQEIFAVCQALPGPASTKMLFSIAQIRAGLIPALLVFALWSLPVAFAMYGLSLGVQRIDNVLPDPVYALLSGLNAATVGIIALAAVQLARKAITDKLTRLLVLFGGGAGLCYNALWYFPVLIVVAGITTVLWDCWLRGWIRTQVETRRARRDSNVPEPHIETGLAGAQPSPQAPYADNPDGLQRRPAARRSSQEDIELTDRNAETERESVKVDENSTETPTPSPHSISGHGIPVKIGILLIIIFALVLTGLMVLRGLLRAPPLLLAIFNNMFLAGTIIFGGGPVVIPLLREYVVEPGWVSPRDFLLGLAIIQAMPGPNFNFAVYLGALAAISGNAGRSAATSLPGAILAFLGIFTPGIFLSIGFQSIWRALRKRPEVVSVLRGVNAAAVGFVFTAVYRLWEIGYLTKEAADSSRGVSLGREPWWLLVASATFTAVEWFGVPPPAAILAGGVAGLGWWGVVKK
ncbi:hypothetical protein D9611_002564 [Ephemerocybe angulata]|uniref:Chromate transporter n=1 Tax=Ephemerocybe angulata TaxID=980116 RepID=A0A8H5C272_9AGAR|nr:hypothetical protein D9611_002564 [Tulosesus angulatus]